MIILDAPDHFGILLMTREDTSEDAGMRIYFVRHGESEANLLREFSNRGMKHGLTERGRAQVAELAERLSGTRFARIYSSPLQRAVESAELLGRALNAPIETTDALSEWDVGVLEGKRDDASWKRYFALRAAWEAGETEQRIEGGESFSDIEKRFTPFIRRLVAGSGAADQFLVVSHGGVYAAMLPIVVTNVDRAFANAAGLDHCEWILVEGVKDNLRCIEWGANQL